MRELSLNVLDIAQNSISAGGKRIGIEIRRQSREHSLTIRVLDDGKGMTEQQLARVCDPFYTSRTTRKVGLGIPLFKMAAEMTGGSFHISSQPGKGTTVTARFCTDHVDMTPLGDINATIALLIRCNPQLDFTYEYAVDGEAFCLCTEEIRKELGGAVALDHPEVMQWITEYLQEEQQRIDGGAHT